MRLPDPSTAAGRAGLAALIAEPARAVVALDFDGTLAPIVERPDEARADPAAVAALARLAAVVGATAIVTGRPAEQAVALGGFGEVSGLARLTVLGHYGFERWDAATGEVTRPDVPAGVATVRERLPGLLATHGAPDGTTVEDKGASLVVHVRRARDPESALAALRRPLADLAAETGLEVQPGRLVLELRPPGMDKGAALEALVRGQDARAVLFAGDDVGDLPAYDAVERLRSAGVPGVTVCSGSDEAPEVAARADLVVDGPAGVAAFLGTLADVIGSGG